MNVAESLNNPNGDGILLSNDWHLDSICSGCEKDRTRSWDLGIRRTRLRVALGSLCKFLDDDSNNTPFVPADAVEAAAQLPGVIELAVEFDVAYVKVMEGRANCGGLQLVEQEGVVQRVCGEVNTQVEV